MKIAGIIAEYNPFHLGHARHIALTREQTGCDAVIICMTGNITQRGEVSCLSKIERAHMALECGADAVFELPTLYGCRTADVFARGGVHILGQLGIDTLSFGCEPEAIDLLDPYARLLEDESEMLRLLIRDELDKGKSHARARGEAAAALLGVEPSVLNRPNAVLGAEYLRAIRAYAPNVTPTVIARNGAYHAETLPSEGDASYVSASAIRKAIASGQKEEAARFIPEKVRNAIVNASTMHNPDDILLWVLRNASPESIRALPDVSEGLENLLLDAAAKTGTVTELLETVKCRRYTYARLSRLLTHAVIGLTSSIADAHPLPEYARLIGFRSDARGVLKELKHRTGIPMISDCVLLRDHPVFRLECRATDFRSLCMNDPSQRRSGREFTERFLIV